MKDEQIPDPHVRDEVKQSREIIIKVCLEAVEWLERSALQARHLVERVDELDPDHLIRLYERIVRTGLWGIYNAANVGSGTTYLFVTYLQALARCKTGDGGKP